MNPYRIAGALALTISAGVALGLGFETVLAVARIFFLNPT
jgi:hypothetical protein